MKKLYLLSLMLLLMFIPSTHAVTDYQLDRPIPELNGYTLREVFENRNQGKPDLDGKTDLGGGWYRIIDDTISNMTFDYNINNGYYRVNSIGKTEIARLFAGFPDLEPFNEYTVKVDYISGYNSEPSSPLQIYLRYNDGSNFGLYNIPFNSTFILENKPYDWRYRSNSDDGTQIFTDYIFTIQIEKGSTATPYQVPTNGPYNNVDVSQFGLSSEQIENYYNSYLVAIKYENVHDPTYTISTEFFLISTFFMYLLIMGVGYFTKSKYLYFAGAILWFVPIFNFTNIFVIITSVIVFISHLLIIFYSDKDDAFE